MSYYDRQQRRGENGIILTLAFLAFATAFCWIMENLGWM